MLTDNTWSRLPWHWLHFNNITCHWHCRCITRSDSSSHSLFMCRCCTLSQLSLRLSVHFSSANGVCPVGQVTPLLPHLDSLIYIWDSYSQDFSAKVKWSHLSHFLMTTMTVGNCVRFSQRQQTFKLSMLIKHILVECLALHSKVKFGRLFAVLVTS